MAEKYPFQTIEPKWQAYWEEHKSFRAVDGDPTRKKFYVLDMFPYPSGAGLHVGHPEGYTATDIIARFKRMQGFNVLHPMGWDAFGLPAEQYAIETGTHPAQTTRRNIDTFRRQIKRLGFSYDWDREIDTTEARYVKWTQWIFLKLYERGLAYLAEAPVWWCPDCGTVLANEEVVDGACERKGHPVERWAMRQWMLKITAYADALLAGLDSLDWPDHIKQMQRNWIGRSDGAEVWFRLESGFPAQIAQELIDTYPDRLRSRNGLDEFKIFTTRPDTLFGATYMVMAPENPLVRAITSNAQHEEVKRYQKQVLLKSDLERTDLAKEKTGVFTGAFAINPVNNERIQVWIADYVLASYGTGAIMAVPAHDQRDLEFARKFHLPVRVVIVPEDRPLHADDLEEAYSESGRMHDSGRFTGLRSEDAKGKIVEWLAAAPRNAAKTSVNYKLRDWLFSRQRYWGEPIPVVHCATCGIVPLLESELPLRLPDMTDFQPSVVTTTSTTYVDIEGTQVRVESGTGLFRPAPLGRATNPDGSLWKDTTCPKCSGPAQRELNTMPQWAGSCWYYLRYLDPRNDQRPWDAATERYWMPVDLYVGGAEHAVLHLLYARFWHKVLYDVGVVSTPEPFQKLVNQGLILGEDHEKMSKSRGNVVNPDDVITAHGADAFRLYEMFLGPLEAVKPWSTRSIEGVDRFLNRVWRLGEIVHSPQSIVHSQQGQVTTPSALERKRHETMKRVTEDIEHLRLNTAISALMELVNTMYDLMQLAAGGLQPAAIRGAFETLVLLLSPFAPHLCEELWARLGHRETLAKEPWPQWDPSVLTETEILLVIQVNGKVRARISVPAKVSEEQLRQVVLADAAVKKFVDGQTITQVIIVPKRLVNIVV